MPEVEPAAPEWEARRVRASGSTIVFAVLAVIAVYLGRELFLAAMQPIGWAAAAAATALVIAPAVELAARVMPRALAILGTLIVALVLVATVGAAAFVEVQNQLAELEDVLPAAAAELEDRNEVLGDLQFGSLVQDLVDRTSERIAPDPTIEGAAGTAPAYLVSGVLVIFFILWAKRMFEALQRQVADDDRRERLASIVTVAVGLVQRYVLGAAAAAVVVGLIGGALARLVDLPTPLVLGVVLGASSLVPYVGVLVGGLPALVLAGALEPVATTLLLVVAVVATQAAHTIAMRRVVEPRSLRAGPAVVVVTVMIGSNLYGVGGALVALVAGLLTVATIEARTSDAEA